MNDETSRGPGRRVGRERILEAAVGLLEEADLADLLSFLGTRAVAEVAGVQPATVHHHFRNRDDGAKPNARLAVAVLGDCLGTENARTTVDELAAFREMDEGEVGEIAVLRSIGAANLHRLLEQRAPVIASLVATAAARNDAVARTALRENYDAMLEQYSGSFEALASHLGRRFDTEHGFTSEAMSVFATALADGLLMRHQFDPEQVDPERFGEVVLRIFEALTVPEDMQAPIEAVTERLLRRSSTLDPAKRVRIVEAVRHLYETGGVDAMTVSAVAREADVSRGTVLANFGDRNGLAAAVWAQFMPDLERRLDADRSHGVPLPRLLERHLHRVIDRCKATPELTALLLDGVLGHTIRTGAPTYTDPTDPRSSVPLPALLADTLVDAADELRPGAVDSPESALDLASTITNLVMVRTMSRPNETTSDTVHRVLELVLDGILRPETRR